MRVIRRIRILHFIFLTTVFIWTVPWAECKKFPNVSSDDTLSREELHKLLSMFDHVKINNKTTTTTTQRTVPKIIHRRKSLRSQQSPSQLIQQLNLINTLIEASNGQQPQKRKTNEIKRNDAIPASTPSPPLQQSEADALQTLALLNSLLSSSPYNNVPEPPLALRQTDDKGTAALLSQLNLNPKNNQDFSSFTNNPISLDTASSNQLSGLIGLLGTLGSLGGGGQILNLGQNSGFFGGQKPITSGLLGNMLGNSHQMNALGSLLGNLQSGSSLIGQQQIQDNQPPGVINSLVGLGSSLSSVLGHTFKGLSGTRDDGKPRVRGFDTRLGLGYRLGQNMDAQLMWEVGPQLFTEPLNNEKASTNPTQNPQILSPQIQNQLLQYLALHDEHQRQLKQKQDTQAKEAAAEQAKAHERLGKLFRPMPSQYSTKTLRPRQHKYFNASQMTKIKIPSGKLLPPPVMNNNQPPSPMYYSTFTPVPAPPRPSRPLLAYTPGPAPIVKTQRNQLQNTHRKPTTLSPSSVLSTPTSRTLVSKNKVQQNQKQEEDPYIMLTTYEKWLMKQKPQGITKRELRIDQQYPQFQNSWATHRHFRLEPNINRHDELLKRMGRLEAPGLPIGLQPRPLMLPMGQPRPFMSHIGQSPMPMPFPYGFHPGQRRYHVPMPYTQYYSYPAYQGYPAPPHSPRPRIEQNPYIRSTHEQNPSYSQHQNFVTESDDSFLRRNAIVTQKPKLQNSNSGTTDKGDIQRIASISDLKSTMMIGGMFKKAIDNPITRYLFPTTTTASVDGLGGDYYPTKQPTLIATPPPTPIPSFYDHLKAANPYKPSINHPHEDIDEDALIHIGQPLPYKDLALTMDTKPRPKVRYFKNGTYTSSDDPSDGDSDEEINVPGMEMFIDVDSGEVSVRKPIASLISFGEQTTPKPKTQEELEDEESAKLYERLQEHFKSSMEEYQIKQEVIKAMQEKKDKIKNKEDESLGLINKFFHLED